MEDESRTKIAEEPSPPSEGAPSSLGGDLSPEFVSTQPPPPDGESPQASPTDSLGGLPSGDFVTPLPPDASPRREASTTESSDSILDVNEPMLDPLATELRDLGALSSSALSPAKVPTMDSLSARPRAIGKQEMVATGVWYTGVILWSYLIVGEYVVGAGMPEFLGWSSFAGLLVGTFLQGSNRVGLRPMGRLAGISAGAAIALVLLLSSALGSSRRSEYQGLSTLLLVAACLAIVFGVYRAKKQRPPTPAARGFGWTLAAVWLVFAGNTLLMFLAFQSSW